jgi:apolipoprotein N-acyltransferase
MSTRSKEWWLLALGFGLLVLSQTRWGVAPLAWIAPVPLLMALRSRRDARFRWLFAGLSLLAWSLATLKIVTEPLPWAFALAYGIPLALVHLPAYFLWDALVKRGHDVAAITAFAAGTALLEWGQAELTPLGVWGAAPATQLGQLAVLQLLSIAGMPGLALLMSAVAASIEAVLARRLCLPTASALAGATAIALTWGAFRAVEPIAGPTVRAAMLRTESTVGGLPVPDAARRRRDHDILLQRTSEAANAGAQLVVWPEAGNLIMPDEESAFMREASHTARASGIDLVVSYIKLVSSEPLRYENRARWLGPDGRERIAYLKHHPVPGEPAIAGAAPAETILTRFGLATLAICYDFDFPSLGRAHAQNDAGLVALPSSDWRGIDPIHTEMAALRAIEGGFSIVRATRFGLSAGIDAHGRLRGQQSTNESAEPFVLASVPTTRIPTVYSALGNLVLLPLLGLLGWALWPLLAPRLRARTHEGEAEAMPSASNARAHSQPWGAPRACGQSAPDRRGRWLFHLG